MGYQLTNYGILTIAAKSLRKVKSVIREITCRSKGRSLVAIIEELNKRIPGWVHYFRLAHCKGIMQMLDKWIRRKLRCLKIKQLKRKYTLAKALVAMGVKEYQAWILASSGKGWWRKSGTPQVNQAMNNE